MAENTFKSPGFFEREIELTAEQQSASGTPAGILGSSLMGPAFVPLTVGTFNDFENRFGTLSPDKPATYAVREWLKNRNSVTFLRTLGAGANATEADFGATRDWGTVKNAGFKVAGTGTVGFVQFLFADHVIPAASDIGFPIYTDNETYGLREAGAAVDDTGVKILRAMLMMASDKKFSLASDASNVSATKTFNLELRNATTLLKTLTVSLDPDHTYYIGKVLNTDTKKFQEHGYVLYLDLGVEAGLADIDTSGKIYIEKGDSNVVNNSWTSNTTVKYSEVFGRFDTRYRAPRTTSFISQPFGKVEYDLFHFECISDGAYANHEFKVSIDNIRKSTDPNNPYGTFDVLVRKFNDTDFAPQVLERFVGCTLNPNAESFIGRLIGDKKAVFDFDASLEEERRLVITGRYPNRSLNIRIVLNDAIYKGDVPAEALPFGFHGIPTINITSNLETTSGVNFPAMPMTFKATKGAVGLSPDFVGQSGDNERADKRIFFGIKTTRIADVNIASNGIYESNLSSQLSPVVKAYTKFMGVSGGEKEIGHFVSDGDSHNSNKFTLARVALQGTSAFSSLVPSSEMREAAYIRNGDWDASTYEITDPIASSSRSTFASLLHSDTANDFNKFSSYAKFTNVFYGGFDGLNVLDADIEDMNDIAASTESGGKAADTITGGLGLAGTVNGTMMGTGTSNNVIASYRQAIKIMTDPMTVRTNLLLVPGIRDPYITDYAAGLVRDYAMAMYLMDIPSYDGQDNRLFMSGRPDVEATARAFENRAIDNSYVATYFPDVYITDPINNRRVLVPASVAAVGALGYNDNVSYPWYAPAGFNRGALDFVENVKTRLSVSDRDDLYESRINPIANFPNGGFVIFGQKTMQINQSALDRVNVRRLMLEVKRQVVEVAGTVLFEQNNKATRDRFLNLVQPRLGAIQAQAGIERFRVICDDTNNSQADVDENRLNGKIILVPTKTIEFIAIDFIVTNSGVSFE
jgi:hypothetical protein